MTRTRPRVGVGLISFGWMGQLHSRAYLAAAEKYHDLPLRPELVIVADPVADNRAQAMRQFGYQEASADFRDVLRHPGVDIVSICSPNYLHCQFALATAAAGKPFWIEKPMGRSRDESAQIADAARRAGLVTAVSFNYRNAPAVSNARELVRSGQLGGIMSVRVRMLADYAAAPAGARTWRYERSRAGTGVLGDLLSHGFDLARYVVGDIAEVTSATATFITQRPAPGAGSGHNVAVDASRMLPVENEDHAAVLARFDCGAVGTFESSRVTVGTRCDYGIEVYGRAGTLKWNFERMNELQVCRGPGQPEYGFTQAMSAPGMGDFSVFQPGAGMGLSFDDLATIGAALFLRSVASGRQLAPSVQDGLEAASVVAAAAASAADGGWHSVVRAAS